MLVGFVGMHSFLIFKGVTSLEFNTWGCARAPWSLGPKANWCAVFGETPWRWFLPLPHTAAAAANLERTLYAAHVPLGQDDGDDSDASESGSDEYDLGQIELGGMAGDVAGLAEEVMV